MAKIDVIVPAAGSGHRMGADKNKLFLELRGIPILYWTLKRLNSIPEINRIIPVVKESEVPTLRNMIYKHGFISKVTNAISGGAERADSVRNALKFLLKNDPAEIVMVHDAARPLFSRKLIQSLSAEVEKKGAAIPVLPVVDTVRHLGDEGMLNVVDRGSLLKTQTPQAFHSIFIQDCFLSEKAMRLKLTDDASYIEYTGHKLGTVEGEEYNLKITTPSDLVMAEAFLSSNPELDLFKK